MNGFKWYDELYSIIWHFNVLSHAKSIEHVGSTSVNGLAAKPIIDIDIIAEDQKQINLIINSLEAWVSSQRKSWRRRKRSYFIIPRRLNMPTIFMFLGGNSLLNHLTLRDHLKENPVDVRKYSKLKIDLLKKHSHDIEGYVEGKTNFILNILSQYSFDNDSLNQIHSTNHKKVKFLRLERSATKDEMSTSR